MMTLASALLVLFLGFANGANDNFKGVATLFGSATTDYKRALRWGTITTLLGSLVALLLAQGLLQTFSGKGLVPDSIITLKSFSIAVVLAAASTVMLATRMGFPVSTTHALTGALVGAGYFASPSGVNLSKLGTSFVAPLIVSPVLAILGAIALYPLFRLVRDRLGVERETCVCIGTEVIATVPAGVSPERAVALVGLPSVAISSEAACRERYKGALFGISAAPLLDAFHFLSAGIVSFARGLNDTPKIAALLLLGGAISPAFTITSVALAMSVGGILSAKRVAETVSHRVTSMNAGQGFTANLVTGLIVIFASKAGLPVSTTHVSCGALFGIGAVSRQARWKTIASILIAWVTTLPLAAGLSAIFYALLRGVLA